MDPGYYTTSRFAEKAGVTVRTLRFYHRAGLLRPSVVTAAGHRRYADRDLIALQQILALKFLGFSLEQIRQMLAASPMGIRESLEIQRQMMHEKRGQIDAVIGAIENLQATLEMAQDLDWESLTRVIKAIQMEQKYEWFKRFYTREQLESLGRREFTPRDQARVQREWADLFEAAKRILDKDPASAEAQALAAKWAGLVEEFTGGDPGIAAGLEKAYSGLEHAPEEFRREYENDIDVHSFMRKAVEIYKAGKAGTSG